MKNFDRSKRVITINGIGTFTSPYSVINLNLNYDNKFCSAKIGILFIKQSKQTDN